MNRQRAGFAVVLAGAGAAPAEARSRLVIDDAVARVAGRSADGVNVIGLALGPVVALPGWRGRSGPVAAAITTITAGAADALAPPRPRCGARRRPRRCNGRSDVLPRGARRDRRLAHRRRIYWDGEAWVGGDVDKLWSKNEGRVADGDTDDAEIQVLWSRNLAVFWDFQLGARFDIGPDATSYLAVAVQGLAPYQFETEAATFMSGDGDVSVRLHQSLEVLFTQRLILEPPVEINAYAQDMEARGVGAGLADVEAGVQLRYVSPLGP